MRFVMGMGSRALAAAALASVALAGCAQQPVARAVAYHGKEHFAEGKYYGKASPRLVNDGEPVPRGGGQYLVGHPYTIAGRTYYPGEDDNYSAVGMASWYGDAFHGRKTANGEIYDMRALSAAHPTMPLPSYARVTNLSNGYSVIVRVNDRGPYHGGRVMDVSSRVADVLDFKGAGTARIKVDYVGRAPIEGSDDNELLASLRTDGSPATINGAPAAGGSMFALATPAPPPAPAPIRSTVMVAAADPPPPPPTVHLISAPPRPAPPAPASAETSVAEAAAAPSRAPLAHPPLPPSRPFDLGAPPLPPVGKPPVRLSQNGALYFAPARGHLSDPLAPMVRRVDAEAGAD